MRYASRKPLLGLITLSMLSVFPVAFTAATGEVAGQQSHFGPLGDAFESAHACNKAFTTWLISGIDGVANDLMVRTQSPGLDPSTLQAFRVRLLADQKWFSGPQSVETVLTQCLAAARAQMPVFEEAVRRSTWDEHSVDEQNHVRFKREIKRLEDSVQRIAAYAHRLADLDKVVSKRLSVWGGTQAGLGLEETRRQTALLLMGQARRWESMGRREIADTLLAYDFQFPMQLPAALAARYRRVSQILPRLLTDISVTPAAIHPLLNDQAPQALAVSLATTCPADVKIWVSFKEGQNEQLQLTQVSPTRYEAAWPAPFLRDTDWQKALRTKQSVEVGRWKLSYEIRSNQIGEGYDLVTQSGQIDVTVTASAPHGIELQAIPEKPSILKKYASEADIPLTDEHHFLSFIYYPILGFPRDLIDAVFGVVDKVPYVSIPVEFVYAGPGQLLCKPWWSDQFRALYQQSAGYGYSWGDVIGITEWWDQSRWVFFENFKTTTFRSQNWSKQQELMRRYHQALPEYESAVRKNQQYNATVRTTFAITIKLGRDTYGETK